MPDLDDFDLRDSDQPESQLEQPTADNDGPQRSSRMLVVGGIGIVIVVIVAFWGLSRTVETPLPEPVVRPAPVAEPAPAPPPRVEVAAADEGPLPDLEDSDGLVTELLRDLSSSPALLRWLTEPGLVERFVASIENVSVGSSPRSNLSAMAPRGKYQVRNRDGVLETDPSSYQRYNVVTRVFTSLNPQATAAVYKRLRPLLQEAFADLGYPGQEFEDILGEAFNTLLETPIPASPPTLEGTVGIYHYADDELESLLAAQKLMLRMGPDNQRQIKAQLRRLAAAIGLEL